MSRSQHIVNKSEHSLYLKSTAFQKKTNRQLLTLAQWHPNPNNAQTVKQPSCFHSSRRPAIIVGALNTELQVVFLDLRRILAGKGLEANRWKRIIIHCHLPGSAGADSEAFRPAKNRST